MFYLHNADCVLGDQTLVVFIASCHVCRTLLTPRCFVFPPRLMKTPAWSQRPSKVELTALTQPTCQPRDSSSRRHLGYSGVLFTMQHSVQHKKIRRERARESESVRNLIHCAWLVGSMAASYLREKCVDFIWHSRGTSPNEVWDGEWVRVRMSGYMLQKKQNIYIECVERHADITSVLLELSPSENYFKRQQKKLGCLPGENQGHPQK